MRKFVLTLALATLPLAGQTLSGRRAPSFNLPDSAINHYDILDYRGKWLVLDFISTMAAHSAESSKMLENLHKQFGARVGILSIAITPPENTSTIANYQLANKLTLPILFDQGQMTATYFKLSPTNSRYDSPHLFVINPAGNIVKDWSYSDQNKAMFEGDGLGKQLQALMAAK